MKTSHGMVTSEQEAKAIPKEDWVCVVKKVPLELRYEIVPEKLVVYEILKPYEGCWCLLDNNIHMRMVEIKKPPLWSFFSNEVFMWDWFQLGDKCDIWLPQ